MKQLEGFKIKALGFPSRATRMIVHDNKTLVIANDFVREVKALIKEVSGSYDPIISHAKAEKKKYIDPLKDSEKTVKLNIGAYLERQEEIRREAEEKARREEEDRQKEEERILAESRRLEDSGKEKEAENILAEIPLPARVELPPEPKAEGLSLKKIVDTEQINVIVEKLGGQTRIPGIRVYPVWKWEITDRELIPKSYYKSSVSTRIEKPETEIITQGKPEDA